MANKLFTAAIDRQLANQYKYGSDLSKQKVVTKIFNPYGEGRWYLLNSDPNDPDYIWAIVSMFGEVEIGSVSRRELESIRLTPYRLPLERDRYFDPINAEEVYQGLLGGKFYAKGGGFDQYGNAYGFERDYDSVYEIHHKPEMNSEKPYLIWDKIDGEYVGAYPNRQRAIEWIERQSVYAKGGVIKTIPAGQEYRYVGSNSIEKDIMGRIEGQLSALKFAGNFDIKDWKRFTSGYLYFLDEFDKDFVKNVPLKKNEMIFRYYTRVTAIGGMIPLVKINLESGLMYFNEATDFGDESIRFSRKGERPLYLNLVEEVFEHKYAEGGEITPELNSRVVSRAEKIYLEMGGKTKADFDVAYKKAILEFGYEPEHFISTMEEIGGEYDFDDEIYAKGGKFKNIIYDLIEVFKRETKYSSDRYPTTRYAFNIDTPSASSVWFRTKYFGDWKENIQVGYEYPDDFFRIYQGDKIHKTDSVLVLSDMLKKLNSEKVSKYGEYLSNEYSDDLSLSNSLVDVEWLNVKKNQNNHAKGGKIGFKGLADKVAARYKGKSVPAKYKSEYGKTYDAAEAKEVGNKVATKVYGKPLARMKK